MGIRWIIWEWIGPKCVCDLSSEPALTFIGLQNHLKNNNNEKTSNFTRNLQICLSSVTNPTLFFKSFFLLVGKHVIECSICGVLYGLFFTPNPPISDWDLDGLVHYGAHFQLQEKAVGHQILFIRPGPLKKVIIVSLFLKSTEL